MSSYIHFSKEQIEQANSVDLEEFLRRHGERLMRAGREKRMCSQHNITINGNEWFDHIAQTGGRAIDFVRTQYGETFQEAVQTLTDDNCYPLASVAPKNKRERKPFELPVANSNMRRVFAYLTKQRSIDREVISAFVHKKLIYEDQQYHNAVFVGIDEFGIPKHAHKRSTTTLGKQFKLNVESSDSDYCFHWIGSNSSIYVFEAPIDMLSYITLHPDCWQEYNYVALCGTSKHALLKMLKLNPSIQNVVFCLDNDSAGLCATERLTSELQGYSVDISTNTPILNDWNEDLCAKRHSSSCSNHLK